MIDPSSAWTPGNSCNSTGRGKGLDGKWMLKLIYPHAVSLEVYLERWLREMSASATIGSVPSTAIETFGGPLHYLIREEDGADFKEILKETLVAYQPQTGTFPGAGTGSEGHAPLPRHASLRHRSSMADILDRVVKSLLRSSSTGQGTSTTGFHAAQGDDPRRNVLSLGCRIADPQARSELLSVQGVACAFPNTTVNVIRSPAWELLLSRIGDDLMFSLLRQHALLLCMPNRCYMQLAGRPVPEVCRHLGLTSGTTCTRVARNRTTKPHHGDHQRAPASESENLGTSNSNTLKTCSSRPRERPIGMKNSRVDTVSSFEVPGRTIFNPPTRHRAGGASRETTSACSPAQASAEMTPARCRNRGTGDATAHSRENMLGASSLPKSKGHARVKPVLMLPRQCIFYSSSFVRKAGFPRGHPLNPSPASTNRTSRASVLDPGELDAFTGTPPSSKTIAARRLALNVFCRDETASGNRFATDGLVGEPGPNARAPSGPKMVKVGIKSRLTGERESTKGHGRRLPKRLHGAVPLFEEMLDRAGRCNFGRLLETHCTLPEGFRDVKKRQNQWGHGMMEDSGEDNGDQGPGCGFSNSSAAYPREAEENGTASCPFDLGIASQDSVISLVSTEKDAASGERKQRTVDLTLQAATPGTVCEERDEELRGATTARSLEGKVLFPSFDTAFDCSARSPSVVDRPEASAIRSDKMCLHGPDDGHPGGAGKSLVGNVSDGSSKRRRLSGGRGDAVGLEVSCTEEMADWEDSNGTALETESDGDQASDVTVMEVEEDQVHDRGGNVTEIEDVRDGVAAHETHEEVTSSPENGNAEQQKQQSPSLGINSNFMEMASDQRHVADFLCQACHRVIPAALWGSKHNMVCMFRAVERFVMLRRHEGMSVLEVTAGMKTSDLEWMSLSPANSPPKGRDNQPASGRGEQDNETATARHEKRKQKRSRSSQTGGQNGNNSDDGYRAESYILGGSLFESNPTQSTPSRDDTVTGTLGKNDRRSSTVTSLIANGERTKKHDAGPLTRRELDKRRISADALGTSCKGSITACVTERTNRRIIKQKGTKATLNNGLCRVEGTSSKAVWTSKRGSAAACLTENVDVEGTQKRKRVAEDWMSGGEGGTTSEKACRAGEKNTRFLSERVNGKGKDAKRNKKGLAGGKMVGQAVNKKREGGSSASGNSNRTAGSRGGGRVPPSELAKRTDMLEALVYWTFKDFITPLLRALFYVTECESASQEVFFFRKPVWAKFRTLSLRHLTARQYQRITARQAFRASDTQTAATISNNHNHNRNNHNSDREQDRAARAWDFPVSGIRLVPKVNGVRALANLSRRTWADRDRVQWVKGVPLPAPQRCPPSTLRRSISNPTSRYGDSSDNDQSRGNLNPLRRTTTYAGSATGRGAGGRMGGTRANGVGGGAVSGQGEVPRKRGRGVGEGSGGGGVLLPSTNMQLSNAFYVLKHEYRSKPSLIGAGVFGFDDVFAKIKPFVARILRAMPSRAGGKRNGCNDGREGTWWEEPREFPKLYFASVDIKHCYDTVDQARLMEIVRPLLTSEDYVVRRYSKAHPFKAVGRVQVAHVREAVALEDMSQFKRRCEGLADESTDTIFTDQVVYGIVSRDDVLDMIEDHVTNNVVKVPSAGVAGRDAYFKQAVGIPQGSVLSGLLCNYFFGHIEKRLLGDTLGDVTKPSPSYPPTFSEQSPPSVFEPWQITAEGDTALDNGVACHGYPRSDNRLPGDNLPGGSRWEGDVAQITAPFSGCRTDGDGRRRMNDNSWGGAAENGGGDMENGRSRMDEEPESDCTLLRQVDDFVLISTSKEKAAQFVRTMHDKEQAGSWGFSVHEAKTIVNFDMTVEGVVGEPAQKVRRVEGSLFPWCGLRFNTNTCEVMANYSRLSKSGVSESVTVESRRAGASLRGRMKRFVSPKCHALMLDEGESGLNSRQTVLLNVYEMILVCAAKTAASALRLPRGPASNESLLSSGAIETTEYAYSLIQSRSNRRKGGFGTSKGIRCTCKARDGGSHTHAVDTTEDGATARRSLLAGCAKRKPRFYKKASGMRTNALSLAGRVSEYTL